jgi:L-arabinose isomerase
MTARQNGAPAQADDRPRVALLGIMQELYDDMLPGITERQGRYAQKIADRLSDVVDVTFEAPARTRAGIERQVRRFNDKGLDGIMIVMLTYGPAMRTVRALSENQLPVMLANVQPERTITEEWDMADLTYNQGVHGAQDLANTLLRLGIDAPIISEDWRADRFKEFVADWAHAAQSAQSLKDMRLAQFGQMPGMGDIVTDPSSFMQTLGPQVDQLGMGLIEDRMQSVSDEAVTEAMEADCRRFEVDDDLTKNAHLYASRFQVAIEDLLDDEDYEGFSIYFDAVGDDGRFEQLHMLAASNLLAKGYGYAAEGDMCCTSLVAAGHRLAPNAHFTEMYAMDFERDSVLQSHMGEGNWQIARSDHPVQLIDRELGIGGLDNPPTVLFMAEPGPATLVSLAPVSGEDYRLVVATGKILDTDTLPNVEMPYFHFRPDSGVRDCLDSWIENGGTHHQCLHLGDVSRRWDMFGEMVDIDVVHV